jgi:hypothetical protein
MEDRRKFPAIAPVLRGYRINGVGNGFVGMGHSDFLDQLIGAVNRITQLDLIA